MAGKIKHSLYRLCKLCMAIGVFLHCSIHSIVFFGEPEFPYPENTEGED